MLKDPPLDPAADNGGAGDAMPPVIEPLRAALKPLAARIAAAFFYGPAAKGGAPGDIELVIIANGIAYLEVLPHLITTARQIGRRINPAIYSADELNEKISAGSRAVLALLKQPRVFLIGSERDLPQIH